MKFFTDHYFQIGQAHIGKGQPCQDHALSRSGGQVACAIVSDGCSTGGNTDAGARIITFGTLQAIRDHAKASGGELGTAPISIGARQQQLIGISRPLLGLESNDLYATCAYVYLGQKGGLFHVQGDGVIACKYWDGAIVMRRYDWDNNTPFYPSYEGGDIPSFVKAHGGDPAALRLTESTVVRNAAGEYSEAATTRYTIEQGIAGLSLEIPFDQLSQIEFLAVFSDGVTQIENVDWRHAVASFLDFKSKAGEFAKRRMISGIKEMQKLGKGPLDDISYAVVRLEADAAETEKTS